MPSSGCFRGKPISYCCIVCGIQSKEEDIILSIPESDKYMCFACSEDYITITPDISFTSFIENMLLFQNDIIKILEGLNSKVLAEMIKNKTKLPTEHLSKDILIESFLHLMEEEKKWIEKEKKWKETLSEISFNPELLEGCLAKTTAETITTLSLLKCPDCGDVCVYDACSAVKCPCNSEAYFCGICEKSVKELPEYGSDTNYTIMHRHVALHGYKDTPEGLVKLFQLDGTPYMEGPFDSRMPGDSRIYGATRFLFLEGEFKKSIKPYIDKILDTLKFIMESIIKLDSNFQRPISDLIYSLLGAYIDESGKSMFYNPLADIIKSEIAKYRDIINKSDKICSEQEIKIKKLKDKLETSNKEIFSLEKKISELESYSMECLSEIANLKSINIELKENAKEKGDILLREKILDLIREKEITTQFQQSDFERKLQKLKDEIAGLENSQTSVSKKELPVQEKRGVCHNFSKSGSCPYGGKCRFLHIKEDRSFTSVCSDGSYIKVGTKHEDRKSHQQHAKFK